MKNNINKLINNDRSSVSTNKEETWQMKHRVISVRNKIFIVWFIIIWYILVANYILPSYKKLQQSKASLHKTENQIQEFKKKELVYKDSLKLIKKIKDNETKLVNCINSKECEDISQDLTEKLERIVKFLKMNNLSDEKMNINEKLILSSLNEFLIREDPLNIKNLRSNGIINSIVIWDEEKFNSDFYYTPLELNITFDNKDGLLSFINNIEHKISEEKENRILYQISEINYNIINHEETQDVSFLINIFYMK